MRFTIVVEIPDEHWPEIQAYYDPRGFKVAEHRVRELLQQKCQHTTTETVDLILEDIQQNRLDDDTSDLETDGVEPGGE